VKAQIFTTIPEGLLVEVQKLSTAKEIWDAVCHKHEAKGLMVQVDLCHCMQELKCKEDTDVCTVEYTSCVEGAGCSRKFAQAAECHCESERKE